LDQKAKDEFLFYYIGIKSHEIEAAEFEQLSADDWDGIIQQADRHRVIPLLYHHLRLLGLDALIPADSKEELQETYLHVSWRNTKKYHELSKIIGLLRYNGIPVILLKGIALAELVYESIALRPMTDIDLLVKHEDIWKTDKVLSQLGYESNIYLSSESYEQRIEHVNYKSWRYSINVPPTLVDVHTRIAELPNLDPWANASRVTIASTDMLMLGAEDLLLHLCAHVHSDLHRFGEGRLLCWYDIAAVLKHYGKEIDWDYVIQITQEHQFGKAFHRILRATIEWFDVHVPAEVFQQFVDDSLPISISDVLYPPFAVPDPKVVLFLSSVSAISEISSVRGKIHYVFRVFFPRRKFMVQRYPISRPSLVYFYYPLRIIQGSLIAAKTLLFRLSGYLKSKPDF